MKVEKPDSVHQSVNNPIHSNMRDNSRDNNRKSFLEVLQEKARKHNFKFKR